MGNPQCTCDDQSAVGGGERGTTSSRVETSLGHEKPLLINVDPSKKRSTNNQTDEVGDEK